jgi:hypothetical protein
MIFRQKGIFKKTRKKCDVAVFILMFYFYHKKLLRTRSRIPFSERRNDAVDVAGLHRKNETSPDGRVAVRATDSLEVKETKPKVRAIRGHGSPPNIMRHRRRPKAMACRVNVIHRKDFDNAKGRGYVG